VDSEITEIRLSRPHSDRGTAIVRSDTRNQHGEVVRTPIARLVVPRRSPIDGD
jgi:acyl dehydratase